MLDLETDTEESFLRRIGGLVDKGVEVPKSTIY